MRQAVARRVRSNRWSASAGQMYVHRHAFELYVHLIFVPPAVVVMAPWSLFRQNCPAE